MSGNKVFETKIQDDENADSGFLSGPLDQFPSGLDDEPSVCTDDLLMKPDGNRGCDTEEDIVDPDSGVGLCVASLDLLSFKESPTARDTAEVVTKQEIPDNLPPLAVLFQQDDDGDTQLHIAAVHGCEKSVRILMRVCPEKWFLDLQNDYGHTALHLAVMSGQPVVARMLVRQGASLGVRDLKGNTPVHVATAARSVQCLQALLGPLDNDNQRMDKSLAPILNMINYNGQTCVHIAANLGHLEALQTLLFYGADVNAIEGYAGRTALHIAAQRGDLLLTQCLQKSRGVAVRARDYAGRTPRRLAKRVHAFTTKEGQRIFKTLPEESDSETDDDDEYDSEDEESLFDKIRSKTQATTSMVN